MKNNNASIFAGSDTAGVVLSPFSFDHYLLPSTGTTKQVFVPVLTTAGKSYSHRRPGNSIVTEVITGDASSNTVALHTIVTSGFKSSLTGRDLTVHKKQEFSCTFTDWGTFGTDGYITVGGWRPNLADSTTTALCNQGCGFLRAQIWDSVLTDQQILNTVGGDGTVFSMPSYSEGSYPEPNHQWKPVLGNNSTIPDTGSDTAINLTIAGSAKVGYYLVRS